MSKEKAKLAALLIEQGYTKEAMAILEGNATTTEKQAINRGNEKLLNALTRSRQEIETKIKPINESLFSFVHYANKLLELPNVDISKSLDYPKSLKLKLAQVDNIESDLRSLMKILKSIESDLAHASYYKGL